MNHLLNRTKHLGLAAVLFIVPSLAHAEVQPEANWYTMPRDMSQHGHRIDWLIDITSLFAFILFVIMCAWMAIAYIKHTNGHEAEYDHGNARKQVLKAGILSSVIFVWIDGNLFYNAMKDLDEAFWDFDGAQEKGWHFQEDGTINNEGTLRLQINAHQWAWDARYAGPDGKFNTPDDIVTLNDIRVPENKTIYVQISSTDVIHSFALPNFRVKQDAMPGMITHMLAHTAEGSVGEYDISCAQHCGAAHYLMRGTWIVQNQEDFNAWSSLASERALTLFKKEITVDDAGTEQVNYVALNPDSQWGWTWKEK